MDFRETEVVEVRLWYGKCAYSVRSDIMTEHLYFVSLKTTKKERKTQITIQHTTIAVDRGKLERRIKNKR